MCLYMKLLDILYRKIQDGKLVSFQVSLIDVMLGALDRLKGHAGTLQ